MANHYRIKADNCLAVSVQLAHATKPTGQPAMAHYIELAKAADLRISGKTHTVDLGDVDDEPIEINEEETGRTPMPQRNETPEARVIYKREASTPTPATTWASRKPTGQRTSTGAEALKQMTSYFDPNVRTQLHNNQAVNSLFLG